MVGMSHRLVRNASRRHAEGRGSHPLTVTVYGGWSSALGNLESDGAKQTPTRLPGSPPAIVSRLVTSRETVPLPCMIDHSLSLDVSWADLGPGHAHLTHLVTPNELP